MHRHLDAAGFRRKWPRSRRWRRHTDRESRVRRLTPKPVQIKPLAGSIASCLAPLLPHRRWSIELGCRVHIAEDRNEDTEQILEEVMVTGVRSKLIEAMDVSGETDGSVVDPSWLRTWVSLPVDEPGRVAAAITNASIDCTGQSGCGRRRRSELQTARARHRIGVYLVPLKCRTMPSSASRHRM